MDCQLQRLVQKFSHSEYLKFGSYLSIALTRPGWRRTATWQFRRRVCVVWGYRAVFPLWSRPGLPSTRRHWREEEKIWLATLGGRGLKCSEGAVFNGQGMPEVMHVVWIAWDESIMSFIIILHALSCTLASLCHSPASWRGCLAFTSACHSRLQPIQDHACQQYFCIILPCHDVFCLFTGLHHIKNIYDVPFWSTDCLMFFPGCQVRDACDDLQGPVRNFNLPGKGLNHDAFT